MHRTARLFALLLLLAPGACGRDEPERPPRRPPETRPWPGEQPPLPTVPEGRAEAVAAAAGSVDVLLPAGGPVVLDGVVGVEEWSDAAQRPLGFDGDLLRLKQDHGTLLVALSARRPWPEGGRLSLYFAPEGRPAEGRWTEGAVVVDLEPREHLRPHLLVQRHGERAESPVEGQAVARARPDEPGASAEIAVDLGLLGVEDDAAPPLRFAAVWSQGPGRGARTWPYGLEVAGAPGRAPADLASSARWGRLLGWRAADGEGSFDPATWARLLAEDEELTRRGIAAHALVMEMEEEAKIPKADVEMVPALVGNLRWIAEREPLTPLDLLALAKGYRGLNRAEEALAVLDALAAVPSWRDTERVLYERALVLQDRQRFEESAALWDALAARPVANAAAYAASATRDRERAVAWATEAAARAEDAARPDLPLVLLRTNRGDVVIQLFADDVPEATRHFLALVTRKEDGRGLYDGTLFHRVIAHFLVQGGDPTSRDVPCHEAGTGSGPETVNVEVNPRHGFWRGAVGFARGLALVNESQFFVLTAARPELETQTYTCFGHVVSGMDVVDRLETCDVLLEARVLSAAVAGPPDGGGPRDDGGAPGEVPGDGR